MSKEFRFYFLTILFLLSAIFVWLSFLPPANAAMLCGPRKQVIDGFKANYAEKEVWFGTPLNSKDVVLLLLSSDKGTWTLLIVRPDTACVLAGGTGSGGSPA